jgi:hypothetical protein
VSHAIVLTVGVTGLDEFSCPGDAGGTVEKDFYFIHGLRVLAF